MQRTTIKSSLLKSVGYDPATRVLEVEFAPKKDGTSGRVYRYDDIPADKYAAMIADTSIGKYFLAKIKPDYKCTRIEEDNEEKDQTSTAETS